MFAKKPSRDSVGRAVHPFELRLDPGECEPPSPPAFTSVAPIAVILPCRLSRSPETSA